MSSKRPIALCAYKYHVKALTALLLGCYAPYQYGDAMRDLRGGLARNGQPRPSRTVELLIDDE